MPEGKASPETLKLQKKYDNEPNSRVFVRLADSYLKDNLEIVALEIALAGVEKHPKYIQGLIVLAKCYDKCGNINKSIETFDMVLKIDPENFFVLKNAGKNYYEIGNKIKALELYKTLFDLSPFDDKLQVKIEQIEEEINTSPETAGFFKKSIDEKNLSEEDTDLPINKTEEPAVEEIKKDKETDTLNLIKKDILKIEKSKSQELKENEALTFLEQELNKLDSEKFYTEDTSSDQREEIKTELSSTSEQAKIKDEVLEKAITDDELLDLKTLVEDEEYLKDSKIDFGQSPELEKDDKFEKEIFGIKDEKFEDEKPSDEIADQDKKEKVEIKQENIQSEAMITKEVEELEKELEDSLSGDFEKPIEEQKKKTKDDNITEKADVEEQEKEFEDSLLGVFDKPIKEQKDETEPDTTSENKIPEKADVKEQEKVLDVSISGDSEKPIEDQKNETEDDNITEKADVEEQEKEFEDSLLGVFDKPIKEQKDETEPDTTSENKIPEKADVEKQEKVFDVSISGDSEKPIEDQKQETKDDITSDDKITDKADVEEQEKVLDVSISDDSEKPIEDQKQETKDDITSDDKITDKADVDKEEKIPEDIPPYNGEIRSITMAKIYEEQGNIDKAINVYKSLLDEHPEVHEDIKRLESVLKINESTDDKKDVEESKKDEPTKGKGIDEFKNWLDSIE